MINPSCTCFVWSPKKDPSITISLVHNKIDPTVTAKPKSKVVELWLYPCIVNTVPIAKLKRLKLTKIGQGECCTKFALNYW